MRRVVGGEPAATEQFLERLGCLPGMVRARNRKLGGALTDDELRDVLQDAITAIWSRLASFEGRASLETWMYRFAANELYNRLASVRRQRQALEQVASDEFATRDAAQLAHPLLDHPRLHRAVDRLGPPDNDIIRWKHFDGHTFAEIAILVGLPASTVKSRYYRALEQLHDALAPIRNRELA